MLEENVLRLGNDIADLSYKINLLEEEVAKLNAVIIELKEGIDD
tara:strand:- start:156 stop:287 length:132 start_codon:yes stop_codon:yes gene_type:complete